MTAEVIDGQLDLLELLGGASTLGNEAALEEHDASLSETASAGDPLIAWGKSLGIRLCADSTARGRSVYLQKGGPRAEGINRPHPDEPFHPHFSGYPIPPHSTQTVAEAEAYYLPKIAEAEEKGRDYEGMPISGDDVARWGWFQGPTGWLCFPRYRDIWPVLYGSEPPATRASEGHHQHCHVDHPATTTN